MNWPWSLLCFTDLFHVQTQAGVLKFRLGETASFIQTYSLCMYIKSLHRQDSPMLEQRLRSRSAPNCRMVYSCCNLSLLSQISLAIQHNLAPHLVLLPHSKPKTVKISNRYYIQDERLQLSSRPNSSCALH